jgi:predicted RNA-binding protein Jag
MLEKNVKKDIIIHLEVNDYLQEKDQKLFRFIDSKIDFVVRTSGRVALPHLTAFDRKKVHSYVAEKNIDGLTTQSE